MVLQAALFFGSLVFSALSQVDIYGWRIRTYHASIGAATFSFTNRCPYTVWPGVLTNPGIPPFPNTGFALASGASATFTSPTNWAGRFWPRTSCSTDAAGKFTCATGDCGTNHISCDGHGGVPPTTLVEFTLSGADGKDFYDTSLVDGFNAPVSVTPQGGSGDCKGTGCPGDVNAACPPELQLKGAGGGAVVGCKSACLAFKQPQYCCTGAFGSPATCKPTNYSSLFKSRCPLSYSYAYDDASSTFTCSRANYLITFCP